MNKRLTIFVLIAIIIFVGCSKKDVYKTSYTLIDENDHWKAKCKYQEEVIFTEKGDKIDSELNEDSKLEITYKGELSDLSSVKHIEISYETDFGSGNLGSNYDNGVPTKTFLFTSIGRITSENDTIFVTIDLDGKIETLELKVQSRSS